MELLVISTLNWKMNPVTSLSFIDHIIRRIQFKNCSHLEFQSKCESLILAFVIGLRSFMQPRMTYRRFAYIYIYTETDPLSQPSSLFGTRYASLILSFYHSSA